MKGRLAWTASGAVLLSLLAAACGGENEDSGALPAMGSEVCNELNQTERFRYKLGYALESPKQADPPDDSAGAQYGIPPSQPDFQFETNHEGTAVRPDRFDLVISTAPDQPTARTIRIGENQWYQFGDQWQIVSEPQAFPLTPPNVCESVVSPLDLAGKTADVQNVGDTEARHVRVEGAALPVGAQLFGPGSDMARLLTSWDVDLWLATNDDRLVKVEAFSTATYPYGRELSLRVGMEVGSYNDDEIQIEPPS